MLAHKARKSVFVPKTGFKKYMCCYSPLQFLFLVYLYVYCLYTSAVFVVISCEEFSVCKSVHKNKLHCSAVLPSSLTHKQHE